MDKELINIFESANKRFLAENADFILSKWLKEVYAAHWAIYLFGN